MQKLFVKLDCTTYIPFIVVTLLLRKCMFGEVLRMGLNLSLEALGRCYC